MLENLSLAFKSTIYVTYMKTLKYFSKLYEIFIFVCIVEFLMVTFQHNSMICNFRKAEKNVETLTKIYRYRYVIYS